MAEAEVFEVGAAWVANAITAFTIYISFTFAYLTAAYVIGKGLSRFQVAVINVLYTLSAASASVLASARRESYGSPPTGPSPCMPSNPSITARSGQIC